MLLICVTVAHTSIVADTIFHTKREVYFSDIITILLAAFTAFAVIKVKSISAVDTLTLAAGITSIAEASSLLTLISTSFKSGSCIAHTTSIDITFSSAPTVNTFIDSMSGTGSARCVTFIADITVGASACTCCVTFFAFSFVVKVLVPVTFDHGNMAFGIEPVGFEFDMGC